MHFYVFILNPVFLHFPKKTKKQKNKTKKTKEISPILFCNGDGRGTCTAKRTAALAQCLALAYSLNTLHHDASKAHTTLSGERAVTRYQGSLSAYQGVVGRALLECRSWVAVLEAHLHSCWGFPLTQVLE